MTTGFGAGTLISFAFIATAGWAETVFSVAVLAAAFLVSSFLGIIFLTKLATFTDVFFTANGFLIVCVTIGFTGVLTGAAFGEGFTDLATGITVLFGTTLLFTFLSTGLITVFVAKGLEIKFAASVFTVFLATGLETTVAGAVFFAGAGGAALTSFRGAGFAAITTFFSTVLLFADTAFAKTCFFVAILICFFKYVHL